MDERGREAGHSLVELLIAAALLSLVMAATLSILQSGLAA
jgi:Tfp pilus assembly protein PilW